VDRCNVSQCEIGDAWSVDAVEVVVLGMNVMARGGMCEPGFF
jgi:hypothetical protein